MWEGHIFGWGPRRLVTVPERGQRPQQQPRKQKKNYFKTEQQEMRDTFEWIKVKTSPWVQMKPRGQCRPGWEGAALRRGWTRSTVQVYHPLKKWSIEGVETRINGMCRNSMEIKEATTNILWLPSTAKALWSRSFAALTTALTTDRALLQFLSSSLALLSSWDWRSPSYSLLCGKHERENRSEWQHVREAEHHN